MKTITTPDSLLKERLNELCDQLTSDINVLINLLNTSKGGSHLRIVHDPKRGNETTTRGKAVDA